MKYNTKDITNLNKPDYYYATYKLIFYLVEWDVRAQETEDKVDAGTDVLNLALDEVMKKK